MNAMPENSFFKDHDSQTLTCVLCSALNPPQPPATLEHQLVMIQSILIPNFLDENFLLTTVY